MEKKTAPPQKRKRVVMRARLIWHGYSAHIVTVSLIRQADESYSLYVSGRKLETVYSIGAAQSFFVSKVKYLMDEMGARIIAGGVYYGGM